LVILRPTAKLRSLLPLSDSPSAQSDTALGDWYVNRVVVDRRPLLLLVSSRGLLPLLIPARSTRDLPSRLAGLVGARLERLGVSAHVIAAEARAMTPVVTAPTTDRSVLGIMVDFAKGIPYYIDANRWDDAALPFVESRLAETPCHAGRRQDEVVFPDKAAPALLSARWGAG
jgi:hypothetical protein